MFNRVNGKAYEQVAGLLNIVAGDDDEANYIDNVAEGCPGVETEAGRWIDLLGILQGRIGMVETLLYRMVAPPPRPDTNTNEQVWGENVRWLIGARMSYLTNTSLGSLVKQPVGFAGMVLMALDEKIKANGEEWWTEGNVAIEIGRICAVILNWGLGTERGTDRQNAQLAVAGYNMGMMLGIATSTQRDGNESWSSWLNCYNRVQVYRMTFGMTAMVFALVSEGTVEDNAGWVGEDVESRWGGVDMMREAEILWENAVDEVLRRNEEEDEEGDDEEETGVGSVDTNRAVWNSGMTRIELRMTRLFEGYGQPMKPFKYEPIRPNGEVKYAWRSGGGLVEDEKLGEVYAPMRDVQGWRCGIGLCYYIDTDKRVAMIGGDVLGLAFWGGNTKWMKMVSWTGRGLADRDEVRMIDGYYENSRWLVEMVVPDRVWDAGVELWKKGIFLMSDLADVGWAGEAAKDLWPEEVERIENNTGDEIEDLINDDKLVVEGMGGWLNFQGANSCLGNVRFSEINNRDRRTAPMVRAHRALGVVQGDSHKIGMVDRWVDTDGMVRWLGMFVEKTKKWGRQETVSEMANWLLRVVPADGMDIEGNRWELWPAVWADEAGRKGWIWRGRMVTNPKGWMKKEDRDMQITPTVWGDNVGWEEGWAGLDRCGVVIPGLEVSTLDMLLKGGTGTEGYMLTESGTLVGGRSSECCGELKDKWEALKEQVGWKVTFYVRSTESFIEMVRRLNREEYRETDWTTIVNRSVAFENGNSQVSAFVVDMETAELIGHMRDVMRDVGGVNTEEYYPKGFTWESKNRDWGYLIVKPVKGSEMVYAKGRIPVWNVKEGKLVNVGEKMEVAEDDLERIWR